MANLSSKESCYLQKSQFQESSSFNDQSITFEEESKEVTSGRLKEPKKKLPEKL